MSTGNQEYIRDMNRALVLEAIANHPPLSRADLAKMLHLTKATVSTIVCLLYTSPSPRDGLLSRMPSSA